MTGDKLCEELILQLADYILPIEERTCMMGVLNVTPDSFSDGGNYLDLSNAVHRAEEMQAEGADIIDIGGESSRPSANPVGLDEELSRVIPVIKALRKVVKIPISIDTYKSEVAHEALSEGVSIVNDITALKGDPRMANIVSEFGAAVVLMHMKGNSQTMQEAPSYDNVIEEIYVYLSGAIDIAEEAGIISDKIIIDPGIGFGKTAEHNLTILRELSYLKTLGKPILIGTSHKAFIGSVTGKDVGDRMFGTAASISTAIMNGANIVRVHDIDQMKDVVKVTDAVMKIKDV